MEQKFSNLGHFSGNMKMAELILHDNRLLLVFDRFNIKLGFGDKNVSEVCRDNHIDPHFFLLIANIFHSKTYLPDQAIREINPVWLIDYLKNSHSYYLDEMMPYIEELVEKATKNTHKKEAGLLLQFFRNYKAQLTDHIQYEDQTVFPYILALQNSIDTGSRVDNKFTIVEFKDHHDNIEEQIMDMKNLLIKYFPPSGNTFMTNKLLYELFELHTDLDNHTRIEDKVLVPLVEHMEKIAGK